MTKNNPIPFCSKEVQESKTKMVQTDSNTGFNSERHSRAKSSSVYTEKKDIGNDFVEIKQFSINSKK